MAGVKGLNQISQFDPETCKTEFATTSGSKTTEVQLRAPNYSTPPVVLEDDARGGSSGSYGSINVFKDSCNVAAGGRMWLADGNDVKFIWDLGSLYKLSKVVFRNSRNFNTNTRHVQEFKVSISRYFGVAVRWIDVLHVENLEHPTLCDPLRHYNFNATLGRYVQFTALTNYRVGAAMHYFRVY
ncbi:hypothetical protein TCAL_05919 [Tigriopus californicus]|uniref:F5/8 type C domain-containing protein n=2 Tax=Tigriopus californicus TaxID=6832 RepID=A0A553NWW8_TIGCA|nr:hypothetical protein TCAL_05919 [Tigriopus californicus]|eukprot:TCALIF_05919-PA protein Name:"Protein of unknown function" AED:0.13 eAED:0.13 QI:0/0.5/0/0.66/0.5/0/3/0/183